MVMMMVVTSGGGAHISPRTTITQSGAGAGAGARPTGAAGMGQLQCKQCGSGKEQLQRRKWAEEIGKMQRPKAPVLPVFLIKFSF